MSNLGNVCANMFSWIQETVVSPYQFKGSISITECDEKDDLFKQCMASDNSSLMCKHLEMRTREVVFK